MKNVFNWTYFSIQTTTEYILRHVTPYTTKNIQSKIYMQSFWLEKLKINKKKNYSEKNFCKN